MLSEAGSLVIVYHAKEQESAAPRAHPWTVSIADSAHAYVDFKAMPERIPEALEDWAPYKIQECAQIFFGLLRWLNGAGSRFESNDCAFRGPRKNIDLQFPYPMRCSGRLMILFRDLAENTQLRSVQWLFEQVMNALKAKDKDFVAGAVGLAITKALYKALSPEPRKGALGYQLTLSFFAYAKNRGATFKSMSRVLTNTRSALEQVNSKVLSGEVDALYR